MKKLLSSLFILLFVAITAMGQDRTVTGTVTATEDGLPLPGVSVKVVGGTMATQTNANGRFSISVPATAKSLQFSYIGYAAQTLSIGADNVVNARLVLDATQLSEVVVTALGESREKKALPYSVGTVSEERLNIAKNTDVSSAIAGKVAGVQLQGSPSSTFGNADIIIRGINGLSVGNPLFVVDGTPTPQESVIMDNVENISVLKGASAVALYGNRAANGVVIVTTKKGTPKNSGVEVNLGASFESLSLIPPYQNSYAGGYTSSVATKDSYGTGYLDDQGFYIFQYDPSIHPASWASFQGQRMLEYGADESWGPKMDGQQYRPWYSWYPGSGFGKTTGLTPQPDNVKNFYDTGRNLNNSIAFNGGSDNLSFRMIYQNQNRTLVLPNTKLDQHQFGINVGYNLSKSIKVTTDFNYTNRYTKGQPQEGYRNDGLNITQNFNQWFQRQLTMDELKTYRNADRTLRSWNIGDPNSTGDPGLYLAPQYWDSPYFVAENNYGIGKQNRIVGNIGFGVKLSKNLTWQSNARLSNLGSNSDFRIASFGLQQSSYEVLSAKTNETNYETNLNYKKTWSDFSLDALAGGNIRSNTYDDVYTATLGGLSIPDFFDVTASIARPNTTRGYTRRKVNSLYSRASIGYKSYLYLDASVRSDWSSALPVDNNNYVYPSVGTSFVFSELLSGSIKDVITFGKLRASYAQVGSDLGFNQVNIAINRGGLQGGGLYGDQASYGVGDQYRSGNIKPALTKSWEVGTEFKLYDKVGFDVSYYQDNNTNQILSLDVTGATGFTSNQINAGNIQRKGIEIGISATPVKTSTFSWDMNLNFAKSESFIKELHPELKTYLYGTTFNDTRLELREGEKWGMIVGRRWKTDANGNTLILSNGQPDYEINKEIGSIVPDFTGGFVNGMKYHGVTLSFSLIFQKGGNFFSSTKMFNYGTGLSEYTVGTNAKGGDIRDYPGTYTLAGGNTGKGGILIPGVFANGTPNNRYIPARNYYYTALQKDATNFVIDASYLKLKDVRLGYELPKGLLSSIKSIKNANIGLIVNNAWLISAPGKKYGVDPSELETLWTEGGQLSATRQFGLNLRVGL